MIFCISLLLLECVHAHRQRAAHNWKAQVLAAVWLFPKLTGSALYVFISPTDATPTQCALSGSY